MKRTTVPNLIRRDPSKLAIDMRSIMLNCFITIGQLNVNSNTSIAQRHITRRRVTSGTFSSKPAINITPPPPRMNSITHPTMFGGRATLTIGIVGFGNFGQFLGKKFAMQGHRVVGTSRGDYSKIAEGIGCEYVRDDAVKFMQCDPDVVILCTSIMSLQNVLQKFPLHTLSNRLVVDVLSVKKYPRDLLLRLLPPTCDILCTHPMFGPESGRVSWEGLPFVYDVVRVTDNRKIVLNTFLNIWKKAQCKMIEMSCEIHDNHAASSQFLTHTTGTFIWFTTARFSIANSSSRTCTQVECWQN